MPAPAPSAHAPGAGIPLILATLLSWASVPLFLKFFATPDRLTGVAPIDGWEANGWRYGLSALFWLPLLAFAHVRGKLPRSIFLAALVPSIFNLVGQTCFAWCPYFLDPGFFTFVFRVQIVFVTLGAWVLFPHERATLRSPWFWVGAALVVVGSVGLVLFKTPVPLVPGAPISATADPSIWAILLAVASGVVFAGYGLAVRRNMHGYSPVLAFGVICQYTAVGTLILMLLLGRTRGEHVLSFDGFQWTMLAGSSMIGIAISHVLYYAALTRLGVAVSMGIIQLQPILTGVASMLIFDEQLNLAQWVSGLVGVAGAILILRAGRLGPRPPRTIVADRAEAAALSDAGA
ncbi:MAG: DMT family transporter [Phycisphaerales bacterium]